MAKSAQDLDPEDALRMRMQKRQPPPPLRILPKIHDFEDLTCCIFIALVYGLLMVFIGLSNYSYRDN